jgi:Uma2 family endonuclease
MTATTRTRSFGGASPEVAIPELEPGDRLSRDEFERRYEAMPRLKKAELIEGVVYMPSPVRFRRHGGPHANIVTWLGNYLADTPGVEVADNASVRLDLDNEPQPDAALFIAPECGGQVQISPDDYIEFAPEFVAEVASSSASYDLNIKRAVYRRNGVREYVVWRVLDKRIDWFVLRGGEETGLAPGRHREDAGNRAGDEVPVPVSSQPLRGGSYELLKPDDHGILRSPFFPGLWLDPAALLRGDLAAALQVLDQGLATAEHAAFVRQLNAVYTARG